MTRRPRVQTFAPAVGQGSAPQVTGRGGEGSVSASTYRITAQTVSDSSDIHSTQCQAAVAFTVHGVRQEWHSDKSGIHSLHIHFVLVCLNIKWRNSRVKNICYFRLEPIHIIICQQLGCFHWFLCHRVRQFSQTNKTNIYLCHKWTHITATYYLTNQVHMCLRPCLLGKSFSCQASKQFEHQTQIEAYMIRRRGIPVSALNFQPGICALNRFGSFFLVGSHTLACMMYLWINSSWEKKQMVTNMAAMSPWRLQLHWTATVEQVFYLVFKQILKNRYSTYVTLVTHCLPADNTKRSFESSIAIFYTVCQMEYMVCTAYHIEANGTQFCLQ